MKILYLANIRLPSEKGETLQIVKMCSAFASQNNVYVELIAPRRRNPNMRMVNPYEYYQVPKNFKITRLLTIDLMPWRFMVGKLAFRLNYWLFARLAAWYAFVQHADVIYSRDWRTLHLLRNKKKNLVFELHDFRENHIWAYKALAPSCIKIIVITKNLMVKLESIGIPTEKILVASDAVTVSEFNITPSREQARTQLGLPQKETLVVYTGHLFAWKGIDTLIKAFGTLQQKKKKIKLILVGGLEEDVQRIKSIIAERNIRNILVFGHRPYKEVPFYLKAADILVMGDSGRYDISREYTSPLKLFQYMAVKGPIVAPATKALQEILGEQNAWLYTPDNSEELAETMITVLQSPEEAQKRAAQAFKDVQKHTWDNRAKEILERMTIDT